MVDLARLAAHHVLRGRRVLLRHGAGDALDGLPCIARDDDAARARDGQALGDDVAHHGLDAVEPAQHAVGQPGDRGERVVGAVEDELRPQLAVDVRRDGGRDAGGAEQGGELRALGGCPQHELPAPVVPDVTGAGHLGADVDDCRDHALRELRLQARRVVDAVLQA
jgi:hypothetical protein